MDMIYMYSTQYRIMLPPRRPSVRLAVADLSFALFLYTVYMRMSLDIKGV